MGLMIVGSNIVLKKATTNILPKIKDWLSDPDITKFLDDEEKETSLQKIKQTIFDNKDKHSVMFALIAKNTNQMIGICGLQKIDRYKKNAFLRIIIGEKKYWDGKTALEAEKLLFEYAFNKLHLNKVYSIIHVNNLGQCKLVERLGMRKDGLIRDHFIQNGKYADAFLYSILSKEYDSEG